MSTYRWACTKLAFICTYILGSSEFFHSLRAEAEEGPPFLCNLTCTSTREDRWFPCPVKTHHALGLCPEHTDSDTLSRAGPSERSIKPALPQESADFILGLGVMMKVHSQVSHYVPSIGVTFSMSYPSSPWYVFLRVNSSQLLRTQEAGPGRDLGKFYFIILSGQAGRNRFSKALGIHLAKNQAYRAPSTATEGAQT